MSTKKYNCEILNQPEELFIESANQLDFSREDLVQYKEVLVRDHPGLYAHGGACVSSNRLTFRPMGQRFLTISESGFNNGLLLTYRLLRSVEDKTEVMIQDIDFDPGNFLDSSPLPPESSESPSIIDMSRRGIVLPEKFPTIFMAWKAIVSSVFKKSTEEVEQMIHEPTQIIRPAGLMIANFFAGCAETVLPLERYAEVASFERQFNN